MLGQKFYDYNVLPRKWLGVCIYTALDEATKKDEEKKLEKLEKMTKRDNLEGESEERLQKWRKKYMKKFLAQEEQMKLAEFDEVDSCDLKQNASFVRKSESSELDETMMLEFLPYAIIAQSAYQGEEWNKNDCCDKSYSEKQDTNIMKDWKVINNEKVLNPLCTKLNEDCSFKPNEDCSFKIYEDRIYSKSSGIVTIIWYNDVAKKIVISYGGTTASVGNVTMTKPQFQTDIKAAFDWGGIPQSYSQAEKMVKLLPDVLKQLPNVGNWNKADTGTRLNVDVYKITTTGHSLGGGQAEYAAKTHDIKAYCFCSPPLNSKLITDVDKNKKNYDQEILHLFFEGDIVPSFGPGSHIGKIYKCKPKCGAHKIENIFLKHDQIQRHSSGDFNSSRMQQLFGQLLTIFPSDNKISSVYSKFVSHSQHIMSTILNNGENDSDKILIDTRRYLTTLNDYLDREKKKWKNNKIQFNQIKHQTKKNMYFGDGYKEIIVKLKTPNEYSYDKKRSLILWLVLHLLKDGFISYYCSTEPTEQTDSKIKAKDRLLDCLDCFNEIDGEPIYDQLLKSHKANGALAGKDFKCAPMPVPFPVPVTSALCFK